MFCSFIPLWGFFVTEERQSLCHILGQMIAGGGSGGVSYLELFRPPPQGAMEGIRGDTRLEIIRDLEIIKLRIPKFYQHK